MPDGQVIKIKVDKTTSADTIMELVMRLKCPSAERDDDGRAAYADHYLFKGPSVQEYVAVVAPATRRVLVARRCVQRRMLSV